MPLILDAFNILHVTGVLPPEISGIGLAGLHRLIRRSRYRRDRAHIICDGRPQTLQTPLDDPLTSLRFSHPRTADEVIEEMVTASTAPRRLLVVSSDRQVLRAARRRRCHTITSEAFLQQLLRDHQTVQDAGERGPRRPIDPLPRKETRRWLEQFGVDPSVVQAIDESIDDEDLPAPTRSAPNTAHRPPREDRPSTSPGPGRTPRQPEPAAALPPDVIAEARRLLIEDARSTPPPPNAPPATEAPAERCDHAPAKGKATRGPRSGIRPEEPTIPADLIEEAERLVDEDQDRPATP